MIRITKARFDAENCKRIYALLMIENIHLKEACLFRTNGDEYFVNNTCFSSQI